MKLVFHLRFHLSSPAMVAIFDHSCSSWRMSTARSFRSPRLQPPPTKASPTLLLLSRGSCSEGLREQASELMPPPPPR
jgi:hypothetical protein